MRALGCAVGREGGARAPRIVAFIFVSHAHAPHAHAGLLLDLIAFYDHNDNQTTSDTRLVTGGPPGTLLPLTLALAQSA